MKANSLGTYRYDLAKELKILRETKTWKKMAKTLLSEEKQMREYVSSSEEYQKVREVIQEKSDKVGILVTPQTTEAVTPEKQMGDLLQLLRDKGVVDDEHIARLMESFRDMTADEQKQGVAMYSAMLNRVSSDKNRKGK